MPSFEIPEGPAEIALTVVAVGGQAVQSGVAVFAVTCIAAEPVTGRLRVQPQDDARAEWFTVQGEMERAFAPRETQLVTVAIAAPTLPAPGRHRFRLRVVNVNDPNNDFADSPVSAFDLAAVAGAPPAPDPERPAVTFSASRVLARAAAVLRRNAAAAVVTTLVFVALPAILFMGRWADEGEIDFPALLFLVGLVAAQAALQAAFARMTLDHLKGASAKWGQAVAAGLGNLPSALVIGPLAALAGAVGLVTVAPLACALAPSAQALERPGPVGALRAGVAAGKGHYLAVWGLLVGLGAAVLVLMVVLTKIKLLPNGPLTPVLMIIVHAPSAAALAASLYVELRAVAEGATEARLAGLFPAAAPSPSSKPAGAAS